MEGPGPDDEAVVRAVFDAFARGDAEAAVVRCAPEVEMELATTQERVGRREPYRGHDGVRAFFGDMAAAWDELELHIGHLHRTRGGVMVLGKVTAVEEGRRISRRAVWTWQLRDGLVTRVRAEDLGEAVPAAGPLVD